MNGLEHRHFHHLIHILHPLFINTEQSLQTIVQLIIFILRAVKMKKNFSMKKLMRTFFNKCKILSSDSMFHLDGERKHHSPISLLTGHAPKTSRIEHFIWVDTNDESIVRLMENSIGSEWLSTELSLKSISQGTTNEEPSLFRYQPTILLKILIGIIQKSIGSSKWLQNMDFPIFKISLDHNTRRYAHRTVASPEYEIKKHTNHERCDRCVVVSSLILGSFSSVEMDSSDLQKWQGQSGLSLSISQGSVTIIKEMLRNLKNKFDIWWILQRFLLRSNERYSRSGSNHDSIHIHIDTSNHFAITFPRLVSMEWMKQSWISRVGKKIYLPIGERDLLLKSSMKCDESSRNTRKKLEICIILKQLQLKELPIDSPKRTRNNFLILFNLEQERILTIPIPHNFQLNLQMMPSRHWNTKMNCSANIQAVLYYISIWANVYLMLRHVKCSSKKLLPSINSHI